ALMTSADAGHAAGQDLAALPHEMRKNVGALVVDQGHLLDTEIADFLFAEKLALAARTPAGTAWATGAPFSPSPACTALPARTGRRGGAGGMGLFGGGGGGLGFGGRLRRFVFVFFLLP